MSSAILPNALNLPIFKKLEGKRIVLASKSPRRHRILATFGIEPEIVPSSFKENLPITDFPDVHEYPVATATHKAVEVYERLVTENPDDGPDLVIAADTVVLTRPPGSSDDGAPQEVLEKPRDKADNMRMLMDMNGGTCEVVTGVCVVYPILTAPGYNMKFMDERTIVYMSDNPKHVLEAYVNSGEGLDCAGGINVAANGALLLRKIDGDYHNVAGFPAASFFKLLDLLVEEEEDFLGI